MATQLSGKDFQVLDALDTDATVTQRQLAESTGISLGQINYVLRRLIEKGLITVDNFRKSPNKSGYIYSLTPSGFEVKSRLAVHFVVDRLKEYRSLKKQLAKRLSQLQDRKCHKIIFIGPTIVHEFIQEIIQTSGFHIRVVSHGVNARHLLGRGHRTYDAVLLFDADAGNIDAISTDTGIAKEKLVRLW